MEKRLNNSHYVVFSLVLLVLVMGVISFVRSDAVAQVVGNDYVGHTLDQIEFPNSASLDSNSNNIIDHAENSDNSRALTIRAGANSPGVVQAQLVGSNVVLQSVMGQAVGGTVKVGVADRALISTGWPDGSNYCILVYVGVGASDSRACPAGLADNGFVDVAMSGYVVTGHDPDSGDEYTTSVIVNSIGLKLIAPQGQGMVDPINTKFRPKLCCMAQGGVQP